MTLDKFDFTFDTDVMKQDMNRVNKKPGQSQARRSEKYVVLPKKEGALTLRLLPADTPRGRSLPYASTRLHYINGRSYHCLRELDSERWRGNCPICNYYNFLYQKVKEAKTKDDADAIVAVAREIKPIERYYYNTIVREEFNEETKKTLLNVGPKIFSTGKSVHGRILRACLGNEKFKQKPLGNVMHPFTGRDFTIVKRISRGHDGAEYPNYDDSVFEDESALGSEEQVAEWLENMHDLEEERLSSLKTHDELQHQVGIFTGKEEDDNLGFDPSELELPTDLKLSEVLQPKTQVHVDVPVENDVPFNIDLDDSPGVEADWVKDLQKQINVDDE